MFYIIITFITRVLSLKLSIDRVQKLEALLSAADTAAASIAQRKEAEALARLQAAAARRDSIRQKEDQRRAEMARKILERQVKNMQAEEDRKVL